jgi:hypothetical protein
VDQSINDTSNCEDATYYSANVNEELKYILRVLIELNRDGRQLVVEKKHVLLTVVVSIVVGC